MLRAMLLFVISTKVNVNVFLCHIMKYYPKYYNKYYPKYYPKYYLKLYITLAVALANLVKYNVKNLII